MTDTVIINGVEYAPVNKAKGKRAVIVVDRGWIFAGDVTRDQITMQAKQGVLVLAWLERRAVSDLVRNRDAAFGSPPVQQAARTRTARGR